MRTIKELLAAIDEVIFEATQDETLPIPNLKEESEDGITYFFPQGDVRLVGGQFKAKAPKDHRHYVYSRKMVSMCPFCVGELHDGNCKRKLINAFECDECAL